jgi:hypothetical protein
MGVRRHPDPFAHLAGDGKSGSDWFQAMVAQSLKEGLCPLCQVQDSSLSDYLFWLPENLRDADYFLSLHAWGGFCPDHLALVMTYLRKFPYSQVRLFMLLKMVLEEGNFASTRSCHLCRSLKESQQTYGDAFKGLLGSLEDAKEAEVLTAHLCRRHAHSLARGASPDSSRTEYERGAPRELGRRQKTALIHALGEIESGFHRMDIHELRNRLETCESMLREAIIPGR